MIKAVVPVNRRNLLLQVGILRGTKELEEGVLELKRVQGLVGPLSEIVGDELVKVLSANEAVKIVDEVKSLFIGNRTEGIIRVNALVADAELGELVVLSVLLDGLL